MEPNLLLQVLQVSQKMASMRAVDPLLNYAIDEAIKLAGAERGYVILTGDDGSLELRAQRDQQGNNTNYGLDQISTTIFQKVVSTLEPLILTDACGDSSFGLSQSVQKLRLRSLMCAPLVVQGKAIGAIYVENRSLRGRFREENLIPLVLFANQAAVALENAALHQELEAKVSERTASLQMALAQLTAEVEERQRAEEELRQLASFDTLTGALNRRTFFEQGEAHFALAKATQQPLSLLLFDLDRFKQINDHFGHVAGDAVLKGFTALCCSTMREGYRFGRLGGDEFVLLLPACHADVAFAIGEHIRSACSVMSIEVHQQQIAATVSIGVATLFSHEQSFDVLLDCADQAMYLAKKQGGNCICSYSIPVSAISMIPDTISISHLCRY